MPKFKFYKKNKTVGYFLILIFSFILLFWSDHHAFAQGETSVLGAMENKLKLNWSYKGLTPSYFMVELQKVGAQTQVYYAPSNQKSLEIPEKYALEGYKWKVLACKGPKDNTALCNENKLQSFDLTALKPAVPVYVAPERISSTRTTRVRGIEYFRNLWSSILGIQIVAQEGNISDSGLINDLIKENDALKAELDKKEKDFEQAYAGIWEFRDNLGQLLNGINNDYKNFNTRYPSIKKFLEDIHSKAQFTINQLSK
ncbi:MAG: hypothetical protein US50_C0010G0007 [Candidatus Nomurabacteria bacterium GW2011_GWB1_37_5]|uniref:Uncharacterized protein n=1 Tax=Candidatus Nomurabacteria bacterium GW2011_GWB1_37_5 TaxID=1618742 RepID=A0A0G0JFV3_9BACT|nr:MAG: hypothetical protein US50_C0010G0007 [Candidatus Nomurabacteria bacterium GW2011_GWB1_37_5]